MCRVKAYHDQAVAAGIPALTTAGIYPGTSNVMAAHIVSISRGEYDENWNYREQPTGGWGRATAEEEAFHVGQYWFSGEINCFSQVKG